VALYLHCAICSRKRADGLLSGAAWGRLELPPDAVVQHPALSGSMFRCCPTCAERHPDWRESLLSSLGLDGTGQGDDRARIEIREAG
jgi:hypothetical protein